MEEGVWDYCGIKKESARKGKINVRRIEGVSYRQFCGFGILVEWGKRGKRRKNLHQNKLDTV